ncbi:TetR/AcrR family transcriptional regulator [Hyphomicrobium sp.]|uniref:TetR/AcrR family transcriptional regulator n=1 Tax=Hyphomicrobium sp. TaxID=82 RepID=UPI002E3611D1|nr:TetR/AcrR family transcriptional regulator [Hyphomicrobium sp.]HEX2840037.1 TetR/AcrR family transcriptional regulator [Hyphomicrobium sp.]
MTSDIKRLEERVRKAKQRLCLNNGARADELLEGALACFAEERLDDVTVPLIAKRLNVAHSLIYYYFKNAEVFFQSSVLHALDRMVSRYGDIMRDNANGANLLAAYLDLSVDMGDTLRSLTRIMFSNACGAKSSGSAFVDSFIDEYYQFEEQTLSACIRAGVSEGFFVCDDPDAMGAFISRHIDGIFVSSFMSHGVPIADAMQYLKKMICEILHYKGDLNSPLYYEIAGRRSAGGKGLKKDA